ncbi:MAG: hypothetical protein JWO71_4764 [Candidatus Acidoferrum typicum]|nr:hypothetical protein [Candidatus Acidoferrum typicum]
MSVSATGLLRRAESGMALVVRERAYERGLWNCVDAGGDRAVGHVGRDGDGF